MELSEQNLALAWRNASTEMKKVLYKSHPDWQGSFMNLPGDKLIFLTRLSNQEAMDAFALIKQNDTREAILQRLTSESRQKVEKESRRRACLKYAILKTASSSELPTESGRFSALPTELVAEIARNVPNLWNFMTTNRDHFEIGGDIWVQRVKG